MKTVTTIALLGKKQEMSPQLFSRYWRDVHGVLAARIPGFDSYVQFHLAVPVSGLRLPKSLNRPVASALRWHGVAEVGFADASARAGLAGSDVARLIQADECHVFSRSLLYSLEPGASRTCLRRRNGSGQASFFLLLGRREALVPQQLLEPVEQLLLPALASHEAISRLRIHALASGDPELWQTAGVDNRQTSSSAFDIVLQIDGDATCLRESIQAVLAQSPVELLDVLGKVQLYPVAARYTMVEHGKPTQLGLRGLDALSTIIAAGADNQLDDAILDCLYGVRLS